jgi:hypothetical protein
LSQTPRHSRAISSLNVQAPIFFILEAILFLLLRTSNYLAVDGALRPLQVYQLGRPLLSGNNHLLYPINVYVWSILIRSLGIHVINPFAFLASIQAMNAIAAAAFVTILYALCYKLTNRIAVSLLVAISYGLSRAVLAHATNSAEPTVGLFWSGLSFALAAYGVSRHKNWASTVGGFLLALTMATYQSMVFIGVPIVFLLWQWPHHQSKDRVLRSRIFAVTYFVAGVVLGIPIIYGSVYYASGTQTAVGMIVRFLQMPGKEVYGGVSLVKFVALLPGLAYALFPCLPPECDGFRCLAARQHRAWVPVAGLAVIFAGLLVVALLVLVRKLWSVLRKSEKVAIMCCGAGLIPTIPALVYWLPTYDKLWLQPLAFLIFSAGILANAATRIETRTSVVLWPARLIYALVVLVGLTNLARTAYASAQPTPHLEEAQEVATLVKPTDLLVGDWNRISLLYQAFWAPRANSFNVETETDHDGSASVAVEYLNDKIAKTRAARGQVFFLGLIDVSMGDWERLIGNREGLSYHLFDDYRRCSVLVKSFPSQERIITLRKLNACQ